MPDTSSFTLSYCSCAPRSSSSLPTLSSWPNSCAEAALSAASSDCSAMVCCRMLRSASDCALSCFRLCLRSLRTEARCREISVFSVARRSRTWRCLSSSSASVSTTACPCSRAGRRARAIACSIACSSTCACSSMVSSRRRSKVNCCLQRPSSFAIELLTIATASVVMRSVCNESAAALFIGDHATNEGDSDTDELPPTDI